MMSLESMETMNIQMPPQINIEELWHNILVCKLHMSFADQDVTDSLFLICRFMGTTDIAFHDSPSGSDWVKIDFIRDYKPTTLWICINDESHNSEVRMEMYVQEQQNPDSMTYCRLRIHRVNIKDLLALPVNDLIGELGQHLRSARGY